jgi:hypothetical protein
MMKPAKKAVMINVWSHTKVRLKKALVALMAKKTKLNAKTNLF